MPRPVRARRHGARSAASPYNKDQRVIGRAAAGINLPDDVLACIFSRLPHTADVVRCAATCSRWARAVTARADDISRALPPMGLFVPGLAVGLFHQENHGPTARAPSRTPAAPCFLALASAGPRIGPLLHGLRGGGISLDHSRPVASRNGRLVLELRRESRSDALVFCVCNPMTGDMAVLPELTGSDRLKDYGCALITGDDLCDSLRFNTGSFFRLLLIYNRPRFTALRCYSSDTGRWGTEVISAVKVTPRELHHIGQSVVRRGVAFWPLDHGVLGVRLGDHDHLDHAVETHLLPYCGGYPHYWPEQRLLGVSPDVKLFFMYFGIGSASRTMLMAKIAYFHIPGDDLQAGTQETTEDAVFMPQMENMTRHSTTIKLRWVGEKSGVVLFTVQGGNGHDGTFALSIRDGLVEKVAAGEGDSWRNMVGLEMDGATYLASLLPHGDN